MRLAKLKNHDFSVAQAADELSDALQAHLMTPVTASDAANLTGLPLETARTALAYLAVRNSARATIVDDDVAYIFKTCVASIRGSVPSLARSFGRYLSDLGASQIAYFMGALVVTGPAFVGATMVLAGLETRDMFNLFAGGSLLLASMTVLFKSAVRSISVFLPPVALGGIIMGWERWSSGDVFWIPLVLLLAVAMQVEMLLRFRHLRPDQTLRLLFWGRGFTEPLRDQKKLVELAAALGGTITVGDLMRTFGWTADEAGEQLADILIEYGGDVAVDQDGTLFLRFEELARSDRGAINAPKPSYEVERAAPKAFHGLDPKWVFVVAVICWVGAVSSPLNPIYTEFVKDIDFTLTGIGLHIRMGLGALFTIPLVVYLWRLATNLLERSDFAPRREYLDALEYADSHSYGSLVDHDKFSNKVLVALNAEIDEERSVPGAIWVRFPELQDEPDDVERTAVFDTFAYANMVFDHEAPAPSSQANAEAHHRNFKS